MAEPEINALQISDRLLAAVIGSAVGKPARAARGGALLTNGLPANDALEEPQTGLEYYEVWKGLTQLAQKNAEACTARYEEAGARVIALEDQKNQCYARRDSLELQREQLGAGRAGIDAQMGALNQSIQAAEHEMQALEEKMKRLQEEKKTFDILRFIPVVNLFSMLAEAIKGTNAELERKKSEFERHIRDLGDLDNEQRHLQEKSMVTERELLSNRWEAERLEKEQASCQTQRDQASAEMIAWKDRERYYFRLVDEMEHLIDIEADVEEFKKLIADNPPTFELAA